ncbi:MAG: DUF4349 domain-containing protein, partial [Actinomycetota bacterium]|nr:DUF4349 domain-containing protein [Actinomycetota bacterium]
MNTEIGYLEELREDLLSAAWREARPAARRSFRRPRRHSRGRLVAALAAVTLILAGGIGWYALNDGVTAGSPAARPASRQFALAKPDVPQAIASPAPAPAGRPAALQQHAAGGAFTAVGGDTAGAEKGVSGQGAGGGRSSSAGVETSAPAADLSRIVKTAQMSVVVPASQSLSDQFQKARDIADQFGGFVESSSIQPGKTGRLMIRVPARRFNAALDQLGHLGTLESQSVKGQDVTAQFVDLQARLSIAQTHRNVVLKLLSKAHSPDQIIRLQNLVDDAQLKVEQLQGEVRLIKNQTSKATIDLSLRKSGVALPVVGG